MNNYANQILNIKISNHDAMLMHYALLEYKKHICTDTDNELNKLRKIDKILGYSGNLEDY